MSTSAGHPAASPFSTNFLRSVPLFVCAGIFFVGGAVVLSLDPHYGPGPFTLWALLFTLGFVSSIGGVASWLLAAEPGAPRPSARETPAPPTPTRRSDSPAEFPAERDRTLFGRPSPTVHERPAPGAPYRPVAADFDAQPGPPSPDWDEEGASEELPYPLPDPNEAVSVEDALRDLDGIERDLVPRSRPPTPRSSSS
jgi:hypothetical protein